ncbi:MAG: MlaD family protein [Xanthomonadales bacterium]|nr:MlaD family protein [Xanthomonadales bacterium]
MFKGNRNLVVGLFVSGAIAGFVAFVIWLTGRAGVEEMDRYTLLFNRDISGLAMGGPVNYMGVKVGSVVQMNLERQDGIVVRVDIEVLESTPVDAGTYASIAMQGITGVAVINLAGSPGKHPPLKAGPGQEYPVIPVRDVGLAALMSSAPELMVKINRLVDQANDLLSAENRATIADMLEHVASVSDSLAQNRDTLAALPEELARTLSEADKTLQQVRTLLEGLRPDLDSSVGNLRLASEKLAALTGRLDTLLANHEQDLERFLDRGLAEAPALMKETRQGLRELQKLLQELQEDPSRLIHRPDSESLEIEP